MQSKKSSSAAISSDETQDTMSKEFDRDGQMAENLSGKAKGTNYFPVDEDGNVTISQPTVDDDDMEEIAGVTWVEDERHMVSCDDADEYAIRVPDEEEECALVVTQVWMEATRRLYEQEAARIEAQRRRDEENRHAQAEYEERQRAALSSFSSSFYISKVLAVASVLIIFLGVWGCFKL